MFTGLNSAITGMSAQQLIIDTISHDIANMNTTGFKRHRADFKDLMYLNIPVSGKITEGESSNLLPITQLGLGVKNSGIKRITTQGALLNSEDDLSLAIKGKGFFVVNMPDGSVRYTRDGSFTKDANGNIVTDDGYIVSPTITIPQEATSIMIDGNGNVSVNVPTQSTPVLIGQLDMATFLNEVGLEEDGNNLLMETDASGPPLISTAGDTGFGIIMQRWLEASNVDPLISLTELLKANRAYEFALKALNFTIEHLKINNNVLS